MIISIQIRPKEETVLAETIKQNRSDLKQLLSDLNVHAKFYRNQNVSRTTLSTTAKHGLYKASNEYADDKALKAFERDSCSLLNFHSSMTNKSMNKSKFESIDDAEQHISDSLAKGEYISDLHCQNLEISGYKVNGLSDWNAIQSEISIFPEMIGGQTIQGRNDNTVVAGVNRPMCYLSASGGTVFPMHVENMDLSSASINLFGASKIWIIVPSKSRSKLESLLSFPESNCTKMLTHNSLFATREFLKINGIDYQVLEQREGDIAVTLSGVPHHGFNLGPNVAIAVNFAEDKWCQKAVEITKCECLQKLGVTDSLLQKCAKIMLKAEALMKSRSRSNTASSIASSSVAESSTEGTSQDRMNVDASISAEALEALNKEKTRKAYNAVKIPCFFCKKEYRRDNIDRHESIHLNQVYSCGTCDHRTKNWQLINKHMSDKHGNTAFKHNFICRTSLKCKFRTKSFHDFKAHIKSHSKEPCKKQ